MFMSNLEDNDNLLRIGLAAEGAGAYGEDYSGAVKIDVLTENVPDDFFGVAFHLKINGGGWKLKGYHEGNVFGADDLMVLVKEKKGDAHEIVAGVSLKRVDAGGEAVNGDGVLISFYVVPERDGEYSAVFENGIASVFDGGRKDIEDVQWMGGGFAVSGTREKIVEVDGNVEEAAIEEEGSSLGQESAFGTLRTETRADALLARAEGEHSTVIDVSIFLLCLMPFLLIGYLAYARFFAGRNKKIL